MTKLLRKVRFCWKSDQDEGKGRCKLGRKGVEITTMERERDGDAEKKSQGQFKIVRSDFWYTSAK